MSVSHNQGVNLHFPMVFLWFSCCFRMLDLHFPMAYQRLCPDCWRSPCRSVRGTPGLPGTSSAQRARAISLVASPTSLGQQQFFLNQSNKEMIKLKEEFNGKEHETIKNDNLTTKISLPSRN